MVSAEQVIGLWNFHTGLIPSYLHIIAYGDAALLDQAFLTGCRDYLKDPWAFEELFYRVNQWVKKRTFDLFGVPLRIEPSELACNGHSQRISLQEYTILKVLLYHRGASVSRGTLYYALWGKESGGSRVVDMHIARIRGKLEQLTGLPGAHLIVTFRRVGYYIPTEKSANA